MGSDRYVPWFCCWFFYFQKHRGRLLNLNSLKFSRYHRDIALYVGDGENSAFIQDKDHTGCYSKYRYHEKRQDFSVGWIIKIQVQVDNYAVVKIGYEGDTQTVRVSIDEKNTGEFHTCFTDTLNLSPDWWHNIHIGISSTTGQLADNHDILSVETYLDVSDQIR